jgi:LysM repeat protein
MQIDRRQQNPSLIPFPSAPEEIAESAAAGAASGDGPIQRLERAAETLVQAVQQLQDVFADLGHMLSGDQVARQKKDAVEGEGIKSGETRERMREARRRNKAQTNKKSGRRSDAPSNRKSTASKKSGRDSDSSRKPIQGGSSGRDALAPSGGKKSTAPPKRPSSSASPETGAQASAVGTVSTSAARTSDAVDRLIDYTARNEGGGSYQAWNSDDNGAGVSFGLIQFNQKKGSLPTLLERMHEQNPEKFDSLFGPYSRDLQNPTWVRSANLNDPDIKARMKVAGGDAEFQGVQRDLAREGYFEPAARMLEQYGLNSERAHAMAFDTSVQYGVGGFGQKLAEAAAGGGTEREVLSRLADKADTHAYDHNRRHAILNDPALSDGPFGSTSPSPVPTPGPAPAPHAPERNFYSVRQGDTLASIAAEHGTTWQELARLNGLENPNLIFPGQFLLLRTDGTNPVPPVPERNFYSVRQGDTLASIAAEHGTTWQELARINQLENPNLIFPGQFLLLRTDGPPPASTPPATPPAPNAPSPTPGPSVPAPGAPAPPTSSTAIPDWPQMQKGSRGPHVEELQRRLVQLGYMTSEQVATGPGIFGPKTDAAVRKYQMDHGLVVDGIVGPKTRGSLAGGGSAPAPTPTPQPDPAPPTQPGPYDGSHPAPGTTDPGAWRPVHPPMTSTPSDRSPSRYAQVVNQFAVGNNPRYAVGHQGRGETYCNIFVWDVTSAMGAQIPHWVGSNGEPVGVGKGHELDANGTVDWLRRYGGSNGWQRVSAEEAQRNANQASRRWSSGKTRARSGTSRWFAPAK